MMEERPFKFEIGNFVKAVSIRGLNYGFVTDRIRLYIGGHVYKVRFDYPTPTPHHTYNFFEEDLVIHNPFRDAPPTLEQIIDKYRDNSNDV